jgi:hypothetical protein
VPPGGSAAIQGDPSAPLPPPPVPPGLGSITSRGTDASEEYASSRRRRRAERARSRQGRQQGVEFT